VAVTFVSSCYIILAQNHLQLGKCHWGNALGWMNGWTFGPKNEHQGRRWLLSPFLLWRIIRLRLRGGSAAALPQLEVGVNP
jgi:hypothetical protein